MLRYVFVFFLLVLAGRVLFGQDAVITVNASTNQKAISPYLYGRNNSFSNVFGTPTSASDIELYKEAGLRFTRENNGNNATKYNWRRKISSHPDWYNNVYAHDWNYGMETILENMPGMQTMWAFQLTGKVASNDDNNFNDWGYNQSQWWEGVAQNLAGGGQVNSAGGTDALVEGDPDLYLMDWPADSTTAILDHWMNTLGFDEEHYRYWSMDNEPEIWDGTHDDIMPTLPTAEAFLEKYFDVAKKAREKFPEVKLVGPVPANEWQWYKWGSESLTVDGQYYPWLEYFIKRVAEEQTASGVRLLDVLDIHWYPSESSAEELVQLHRIFYDEDYSYPGANGVKTMEGGWNSELTKEYIFTRIEGWLDEYFGEEHGITLSLSEFGSNSSDPDVNAVLYASMLGTFAAHEVELFTPWTWKVGMWETLHLFSRYAKTTSVSTSSNLEESVSGYSSVSEDMDSLTVVLINRETTENSTVKVNLNGFAVPSGSCQTLQLSSLPASETFVSHTNNALESGTVTVSGSSLEIELPPLSITAILLAGEESEAVLSVLEGEEVEVYPNPSTESFTVHWTAEGSSTVEINIFDLEGRKYRNFKRKSTDQSLQIPTTGFQPGLYLVEIKGETFITQRKILVE